MCAGFTHGVCLSMTQPKTDAQVPFFAVLSNLFKHKLVFVLIFVVLGFLLFLMLKVTSLSQMSLPLWCCNTFQLDQIGSLPVLLTIFVTYLVGSKLF